MRAELPAQIVELVDAFRNPITQIEFLYLLANANILEPVLVDAETADRMVRPYSWFLDRVSPEGIKLTSAGYLRPADVEAASAELGLARGMDRQAQPRGTDPACARAARVGDAPG